MGERLTIEELRRRYDGEWVIVVDPDSTPEQGVLSGVVVAHSPDRNEAYDGMLKAEGGRFASLCFKELPEGWTFGVERPGFLAAFHLWLPSTACSASTSSSVCA